MPIGFVFSHGWGFDASYFNNLSQEFSNYSQIHWESNYFKNGKFYQPFPNKGTWIGIGHSLGFQKLLKYPFQGLISLSGFNRFCVHHPGQHGIPLRVLDRMVNTFQDNPQKVLKDFWRKCGIPRYVKNLINSKNLLEDLELMKSVHEDINLNIPVLSLYNVNDPIVPEALSLQIFQNCSQLTTINFQEKSHILGYNNPGLISDTIRKWLDDACFN